MTMRFARMLQWLIFLILFDHPSICQNYNAEVISYVTLVEADRDVVKQTDSVVIQINNRNGDDYAEISIPWSKDEKITNLEAWIETTSGKRIRELRKSQIKDRSAISDMSMYEDNYAREFEMKHNVYPYRIVYTFNTARRNFITYARWSPDVYRSVPTHAARLRVIIPKGIAYRRFDSHVPDPVIDSNATSTILEWKTSYQKLLKTEIFADFDKAMPQVIVAPLDFEYGIPGNMTSWQTFGNWQYRLLAGLGELPDSEKETIRALTRGITEKREIVRILYHYLQDHTRYINVTMGIGGYKPYPASYVVLNKYGDCKALTNYMKSMLAEVSVNSFYTLVEAGTEPGELIQGFTGPQFNHVVLAVPVGNDTIWLENTSGIMPFGYMGTFTQNREALLISENDSRLVRIPAMTKESNQVVSRLRYELYLDGGTRLKVHNSFNGRSFEKFIQLNETLANDQKERIMREYMPYDNYEVVAWELKKFNRDTARIDLNTTLNLNKYVKPLGNEYFFEVHPCGIPAFGIPAARNLPVSLPFPVYSIDTLEYYIPEGFMLKKLPEKATVSSRFGHYEKVAATSGRKAMITREFELYPGSYSTGEYPEFYAFIKLAREADATKLVLKPAP